MMYSNTSSLGGTGRSVGLSSVPNERTKINTGQVSKTDDRMLPRDGRVGSAPPPPCQPVSRSGRTDVMAMKDALVGWSGGCPMHAQCWTPARWVAAPQCQTTNADSRRGHFRTTLTTGPAGLPHPATWASLPDTGAWTVARHYPIAQVRYTLYTNACALRRLFLANPLSQVSRQPGYRRLHLVGAAADSFFKHSVNAVNRSFSSRLAG